MGRPVPVADRVIARGTLEELHNSWGEDDSGASLAEFMVAAASKVRFQASTRQLVLTFDLAMGSDTTE